MKKISFSNVIDVLKKLHFSQLLISVLYLSIATVIACFFGMFIEKITGDFGLFRNIYASFFGDRQSLHTFIGGFFTALSVFFLVQKEYSEKLEQKERIISGLKNEILINYSNSSFDGLEIGFETKLYKEFLSNASKFKTTETKKNLISLYQHFWYYNNLLRLKSSNGIANHYPLLTEKQYYAKLKIVEFLELKNLSGEFEELEKIKHNMEKTRAANKKLMYCEHILSERITKIFSNGLF